MRICEPGGFVMVFVFYICLILQDRNWGEETYVFGKISSLRTRVKNW